MLRNNNSRFYKIFAIYGRVTIVLLLAGLLLFPQIVAAISQQDFYSILGQTPFYDSTSTTSDCSSGVLPSSVPSWGNQIFTEAANHYGTPPALVAAIYWREHGGAWAVPPPPYGTGNPYASSGVGPSWPDGVVGARGPFQFEYLTWQGYVNSNPSHQVNTRDNQAVIQSAEDLTDAAFGAAKKLADLGGKNGNPVGSLSNTFEPNTIVNAMRSYDEGAAGLGSDLSYVQPALAAYTSLTGNSGTSCGTPGPGNGICLTTLHGDGQLSYNWQPLCPWIPKGGYPAAQDYVLSHNGGQCTWWVAFNLSFNPDGNGGDWYANAKIKKMPNQPASSGPKVGEAVSYSQRGGHSGTDSSAGHVAYIVAVAANGSSYTISEAHAPTLWQVDSKTLPYPDPDINGFIGVDPAAVNYLATHPGTSQ